MAEPTPLHPRRRYTKRQKAAAVVESERTSMTQASEKLGVPITTIDYWMDRPEFVELRKKTREELAAGSITLAHLAQAEITAKIQAHEVEARDLAVIYGIAIDKGQLLAGEATSRSETRDLTDRLTPDQTVALMDEIDAWLAEPKAAE